MNYAQPLYPQHSAARGDKNTCKHCSTPIVYERPGDWYHIGRMKLEDGTHTDLIACCDKPRPFDECHAWQQKP